MDEGVMVKNPAKERERERNWMMKRRRKLGRLEDLLCSENRKLDESGDVGFARFFRREKVRNSICKIAKIDVICRVKMAFFHVLSYDHYSA